ncbi:ParB/RepB/Spo0J family partition protein [Candidatus Pacearchaeota archaeon]|nr:ParB/RepB/Spo0J family partition protein [Candidatus Pacearchaeota archaeon]
MKKITVPLDKIEKLEVQPDSGMVKTVEEFGILQNVALSKEGKVYRVIAGRRRVQAARQAGLKEISAIDVTSDNEAIITLIENIHRSGNPAAEAKAMKELLDKKMTQEDIAHVLHIDRSQVSKRVKLLDLIPELFELLEKSQLKPSVARELAGLPKKEQKKFLKRDTVTLDEAKKAKREENLKNLKKVPAEVLEPSVDKPALTKEKKAERQSHPVPVMFEKPRLRDFLRGLYGLSEQEEKVLKHAYENGLMDPAKVKRKPMDDVAEDFGMKKKTYSDNLVKARRKILNKICELAWSE